MSSPVTHLSFTWWDGHRSPASGASAGWPLIRGRRLRIRAKLEVGRSPARPPMDHARQSLFSGSPSVEELDNGAALHEPCAAERQKGHHLRIVKPRCLSLEMAFEKLLNPGEDESCEHGADAPVIELLAAALQSTVPLDFLILGDHVALLLLGVLPSKPHSHKRNRGHQADQAPGVNPSDDAGMRRRLRQDSGH